MLADLSAGELLDELRERAQFVPRPVVLLGRKEWRHVSNPPAARAVA